MDDFRSWVLFPSPFHCITLESKWHHYNEPCNSHILIICMGIKLNLSRDGTVNHGVIGVKPKTATVANTSTFTVAFTDRLAASFLPLVFVLWLIADVFQRSSGCFFFPTLPVCTVM